MGLTKELRRELERYEEIDYSQYSTPGVSIGPALRSLYHLSKIAESRQDLKVFVPPTLLAGFGDDNRMMWSDSSSGILQVRSGYISPKDINNFIQKHMIAPMED